MMTRFGEIAGFLHTSLMFTIFPFAADLASKGKSTLPIVLKASGAIAATNAVLALLFWIFGPLIVVLLPHGETYVNYTWSIQWLILNATILAITALYTTAEVSANRFGYMLVTIPCNLLYVGLLLVVTGHGYVEGIIPASWTEFLTNHNISSLQTMMYWITGASFVRLIVCAIHAIITRGRNHGI